MTNIYRAIGKSMAARYAVYAVNMISLMVLTRLFSPEIFGVVAAAQTVVVLFQLVAEGGLSPAIINLTNLSQGNRDGIFGFSLMVGFLIGIVMLLSGTVLANFYGNIRIREIVPYIALALFANTAAVLPLALLQRQQFFLNIAQAGLLSEAGALGVTFLGYLTLPPLHAYALYFPARAFISFILYWFFSSATEFGMPKPGAKFSAIKPLLGTTSYQLGFNFLNYFSRNLDNILVGKYMGAGLLGVYDRSYQLMRYPLLLLTFAMTPAIQPVLREINHDVDAVTRLHRDLAFKLAVLGSLAGILLFFLAKPIVLIIFGDKWLQAVPIIRLLALIVPVQTIFSTSGSFFQAFNRTDLLLACGLFSAITNILAIVWGVYQHSLEILCLSLFASFHINFIQCYYLMHKKIYRGGFSGFMRKIWPMWLTVLLLLLTEILFFI